MNVSQPTVPAASEKTSNEVDVTGKNDLPFYPCKNACHHLDVCPRSEVEADILLGLSVEC